MPGFYDGDEYDLAGFAVGVVDEANIIDGSTIRTGDTIIGLPSSGPHSNGYSLIRKVLEDRSIRPGDDLLDELLAPTRIYVKSVLATLRAVPGAVHGMVHITGGGFYENIPRVFTDPNQAALINIDAWRVPEVFSFLKQAGNIDEREMLTTFNCGIGFLLIIDAQQSELVASSLTEAGESPMTIGSVATAEATPGTGQILIR
jgi:phosphoribosylformylglycinamidine cyclo-ligase